MPDIFYGKKETIGEFSSSPTTSFSSNVNSGLYSINIDGCFKYLSQIKAEINLGNGILSETIIVSRIAGFKNRSWFDDFYFRIHFNPTEIIFGNVTTAGLKTLSVWNAFLVSKSVTDFSVPSGEGVAIVSPPTLPFNLGATKEMVFTFSVDPNFSRLVSTNLTAVISGLTRLIKITATIVNLLLPRPNWKDPVTESLEWLTYIKRFDDGTDQAASLRGNRARRALEYNFTVFSEEAMKFENLLFGWQNKVFAAPYWQYEQPITAPAESGDTEIFLSTDYLGITADSSVLLNNRSSTEFVNVLSVESNKITLVDPIKNDLPMTASVIPVILSRIDGGVPMSRTTQSLVNGSVRFICEDQTGYPFLPSQSPAVTQDGYEVYLMKPEWTNPLNFTRNFNYTVADGKTGIAKFFTKEKAQSSTRSFRWVIYGRDNIWQFRAFLARRKGMAVPVYLPSWSQDFPLINPIGPSDTVMLIKDVGYGRYVADNPNKNYLLFRMESGSNIIRPIASVVDVLNGTEINFTTALGESNVVDIHSLGLYRLASDTVDLAWQTNSLCIVEADFASKVI